MNGTNIIIYKSLDHLQKLVLHYLEHTEERLDIAWKGWELAMSRHRTYHWMEELIFGKPLASVAITAVDTAYIYRFRFR